MTISTKCQEDSKEDFIPDGPKLNDITYSKVGNSSYNQGPIYKRNR